MTMQNRLSQNDSLSQQAQLRMDCHRIGAQQMKSGDYFNALTTLQGALAAHGPHVGLISDLVAVLYLMGRIEDCKFMTTRLESELEKAQGHASFESQSRTSLFLGKMFEEQALVSKAQFHYSRAIEAAGDLIDVRVRAQSQLLRLHSFLGLRNGLSDLYQICLRLKSESENTNIELEHGLMLAEIALFGVPFAQARLQKMLSSFDLSESDKNLVLVDLTEEALQQKIDISSLRPFLVAANADSMDEFEKSVLKMALLPEDTLDPGSLSLISNQLSVMGLSRLLVLTMDRSTSPELTDACRKMLMFHLDGLDSESRNLLLKKWQTKLKTETLILTYIPNNQTLKFNGATLSFRTQSFPDKCLTAFLGRTTLSIEDFISNVFEAQLDESYFDRTRIALQRLNKDLAVFTGLPKIFTAKKTVVELISGLQIKAEES